jgi:hypothetical protein
VREENVMDPTHDSTDPEATEPASLQDLVRHLRGYEGVLPDAVRRPLVAVDAPLIPALIALVEDRSRTTRPIWAVPRSMPLTFSGRSAMPVEEFILQGRELLVI